jgi:glycosyltransferase involved in cell wall biosynthesis
MNAMISTQSSPVDTARDPATPRWLNVVAHLDPAFGGLSAAVPKLASSISKIGDIDVALAAFCNAGELYEPERLSEVSVSEWPLGRKAWLSDRELLARFRQLMQGMDGLHVHGLWEQSTRVAVRIARAERLPYVLSAHGMLEPWALNNKRWKKLIYSALIERSNVGNASCLHALTQAEADDYRRYSYTRSVVVIPNGVEVPPNLSPELFFSKYPQLKGKRIVLFLGRIHFKKGLDNLVKAWRQVVSAHKDVHLVLAGPDSENTQQSIARMVKEYELQDVIIFTGMLQDKIKWSALAAAECFVLPSYSEGLSVAALEAMGAGLPVILTDRCHLPEVRERSAGWVIPVGVEPLHRAIGELLENSLTSNRSIGERASALVRDRFTWPRVALQMSEVYTWVAGGNRPVSVDVQNAGGLS